MAKRISLYTLLLASIAAGQPAPYWTTEQALQVRSVDAARPSPDGMWVVYTQTRQIMDSEKSESNTQVWLARADGSRRVQLTHGERSSFSPSFSPDGAWVYFTSSRSGANQVWRIPVDGGEAEQITNLKDGVASYALSPNGKQVAFTAHEPDAAIEIAKKEKRDFVVVDERPANAALYVILAEADAQDKRAHRKIASGDYHVGGGFIRSLPWLGPQIHGRSRSPTPSGPGRNTGRPRISRKWKSNRAS